jgi:hypothetical protein
MLTQEESMRSGSGWTEARAMVVALALGAWAVSGAEAGAIRSDMMYRTDGWVDDTRISGPKVITFGGVARDALGVPGPLLLGEFRADDLAEGVTTQYDRTPFSIELTVDGAEPIWLSGVLDGSITGGGAADLVATFDLAPVVPTYPEPPSGFERWLYGAEGVTGILSLPDGGRRPVLGRRGRHVRAGPGPLARAPADPQPEPTAAAVLVAALAGMAWRRRRSR